MNDLPAIRPANMAVELRKIQADTALAIHTAGRDYLVTPKDIIEWCAPGAPLNEAKRFLVICQTTGLNPLVGDIDLFLAGGKWQAFVRKNGYLKCARRDPSYDGHESGITIQAYQTSPKGPKVKTGPLIDVEGTCVPDGHLLIGGWCKFFKRGISRPVYKRVSFSEYGKSTPGSTWQTIPCTMIEKVAIAHAARESIDLLAGTYDESEMDRFPMQAPAPVRATLAPQNDQAALIPMTCPTPQGAIDAINAEVEKMDVASTVFEPTRPDQVRRDQILEIEALADKLNMSASDRAGMLERREVSRIEDLDIFQAQEIIYKLAHIASRKEWNPLGDPKPADETPTAIQPDPA